MGNEAPQRLYQKNIGYLSQRFQPGCCASGRRRPPYIHLSLRRTPPRELPTHRPHRLGNLAENARTLPSPQLPNALCLSAPYQTEPRSAITLTLGTAYADLALSAPSRMSATQWQTHTHSKGPTAIITSKD